MSDKALNRIDQLLAEQSMTVSYSAEWWDLYFKIQFVIWSLRYGQRHAFTMVTEHHEALVTDSYLPENMPVALGFENLIQ